MRFGISGLVLWVGVFGVLPLHATAQDSEAEDPEDEEASAGPDPLQMSEVSPASEETLAQLHAIAGRLDAAESLRRIREDAGKASARRTRLQSGAGVEDLGGLRRRDLLDRRTQWQEFEEWLSTPQAALVSRTSELEGELERLEEAERLWTVTHDALSADDETTSPELMRRVQNVLQEIQETRERTLEALEPILQLQSRLSREASAIAFALERFELLEREVAQQLWRRSEPPVWESLGGPPAPRHIDILWNQHSHSFYRLRHGFSSVPIAAIFIVLVLAWSWRRTKRGAIPAVAAALLLFAVASIVGLKVLPIPVLELLLLFAGVATLFVGPPTRQWQINAVVTVLYMLDWIRRLAPDGSWVQRIALFVSLGAALVCAVAYSRVDRRSVYGALALTVALVLNIIGYVPLAGLAAETLTTAALATIIMAALIHVLDEATLDALHPDFLSVLKSKSAHTAALRRYARLLIRFAAGLGWLWLVTGASQARSWLLAEGELLLTDPWTLGELSIRPTDLLLFVAVVAGAVALARAISIVLTDDLLPRAGVQEGTAHTVGTLFRMAVVSFGLLGAASAAGVASDRIALVAGGLGVGIGFGLQAVVNNFASGLILMFERPVRVGDVVEVAGLTGTVRDIGIRASRVNTLDGADVFIPNGVLVQEPLTNWTTGSTARRMTLPVGVAYGTELKQVKTVLFDVVAALPDVLDSPTPSVEFVAFGDSSLDFQVKFWVEEYKCGPPVVDTVGDACSIALENAGIEIPFPQRDLHFKSGTLGGGLGGGPSKAPSETPAAEVPEAEVPEAGDQ